jgi:magnesium chelatase family protein
MLPSSLSKEIDMYPHVSLNGVIEMLKRGTPPACQAVWSGPQAARDDGSAAIPLDAIAGRTMEKRLLSISAAGNHPLFLIGPPGIGKTTLAANLVHLLPDLDDAAALESYAWHEQAHGDHTTYTLRPPCRTPHHTLTPAGLVGGGVPPRPGEVTLAHHGVLLLDELFEFSRPTLNALREPMSQHTVHIARAGRVASLPARFLLCATANPCPCGLRGYGECRCLDSDVRRYWGRLSGPVLDRIDIVFYMNRDTATHTAAADGEWSEQRLQSRVATARDVLRDASKEGTTPTQRMDAEASRRIAMLRRRVVASDRAEQQLTAVAATIAALDGRDVVRARDIEESLQFRRAAT